MPRHAPRPRVAVSHEADQLFDLYFVMGEDRSLEKLRQVAATRGYKKPSIRTLERYSSEGKWQERVVTLNEQIREQIRANDLAAHANAVTEMNRQQSHLSGLALMMLEFGLERVLRQMRNGEVCKLCGVGPLDLDVGDMTMLMNTFAKWQRTALGEASERREVGVTIYMLVLPELASLFMSINALDDPAERVRAFAIGADQIVHRHVAGLIEG